jgi:hypothetical protein
VATQGLAPPMPTTTSHPPPRSTDAPATQAGASVPSRPSGQPAPPPTRRPAAGPAVPRPGPDPRRTAPIRRSGDHGRRRCRRRPPRRIALTGKASRPIPRYVAGPCLARSTFAAACHVRVTPRPSPAGPARHRRGRARHRRGRARRMSLTCGNATKRHTGTRPTRPPDHSRSTARLRRPSPLTAMRAAADAGLAHGQLGDDPRGETLPPGSHATTSACHSPVTSSRCQAWTVPSWRSPPRPPNRAGRPQQRAR